MPWRLTEHFELCIKRFRVGDCHITGRKTGRLPRGRDIAPEVPRDWFPTAEDEKTGENISTTMKGSASEFPRASQEGLILSGEGGEVKRLAVSPFSRVLSFWRASKTSPHPRRRQRSLQPVRSLRRKRATFACSKAADICFWVKEEREKEGRGERRERKRETSVYF